MRERQKKQKAVVEKTSDLTSLFPSSLSASKLAQPSKDTNALRFSEENATVEYPLLNEADDSVPQPLGP